MSRVLNLAALLVATSALAKPWNGIAPGTASSFDVIGKFGEPSKKASAKGKEILVYSGDRAISGTVQVQFKVDPATNIVERIDLYPAPEITAEQIIASYGSACDTKKPVEPCHYRRETPNQHTYFLYLKLGLAIFFKEDGTTVRSFSFLPPGAAPGQ